MSASDVPAVRSPSWKTALGLFAITLGYLTLLLGTVFYTWGGMHELYRIPVLAIPVAGLLVAVGGGAMVWAERA